MAEVRAARICLQEIVLAMEALAAETKALPGNRCFLQVHRRPGVVELRWRRAGPAGAHALWADLAASVLYGLPQVLAEWYWQRARLADLLNRRALLARATIRTLETWLATWPAAGSSAASVAPSRRDRRPAFPDICSD